MSTLLRPWKSGTTEGGDLKVGERIDIRWVDGTTSAHDFAPNGDGEPGFTLNHHDTKVWVALNLVDFRKIPLSKGFTGKGQSSVYKRRV
mgnify:CR=1 FL=1